MKISIVTPVYAPELDLIKTQARSIDLRFRHEYLHEIHVMINDRVMPSSDIDLTWWGKHAKKVKVFTYDDVDYHPRAGISGWESQQIMKLIGVAACQSDWSIVLDAKTWFVRDFDLEELFEGQKFRTSFYQTPSVFKPGQEYMDSLLGIKDSLYIAPGGVPNFMKPAIVRCMLQMVQEKTGKRFTEWFQDHCSLSREGVTEFACHSSYVSYIGREKHYVEGQEFSVYNLSDWQVPVFDDWFENLQKDDVLTASIASKSLPLLTTEQIDRWEMYLRSKGL